MIPLTYGALPTRDRSVRPAGNGVLYGVPVFLYCPDCGEQFSATRGDYFLMGDSEPVTCWCGGSPFLARERGCIERVAA